MVVDILEAHVPQDITSMCPSTALEDLDIVVALNQSYKHLEQDVKRMRALVYGVSVALLLVYRGVAAAKAHTVILDVACELLDTLDMAGDVLPPGVVSEAEKVWLAGLVGALISKKPKEMSKGGGHMGVCAWLLLSKLSRQAIVIDNVSKVFRSNISYHEKHRAYEHSLKINPIMYSEPRPFLFCCVCVW